MQRSFRETRRPIVAVFLIALLAAACGSGGASVLSTVGNAVDPDAAAAPAPGAGGSEPDGEAQGGGPGGAALPDGARIVFTGSLSLQVTDLDATLGAGRAIVGRLGGYIGASRVTSDGERSVASISYRIPAARWEEALAALRELGTVVGEATDAAEVTTQIVDLEARIRNLRATETALQGIAEQATRVEDILTIERRLTEVRGQIEQLDAQRTDLEDRAAYGTLTVTFGREVVAVVEAARGWNPGQEVDRASATLVEVLQAVTTAGIWFGIVWLPLLLALLLVLLLVRLVLRRTGVIGAVAAPSPS